MRIFFHVFLFLISFQTFSKNLSIPEIINVGIFHKENITRFTLTPETGHYIVCDHNHKKIIEIKPFNTLFVRLEEDQIVISENDSVLIRGTNFTFQGYSFMNSFFVYLPEKQNELRVYSGDVSIEALKGKISFINHVSMETYIAGVVQAESGLHRPKEFYKVQAIIARTYALKNQHRHRNDNFDVCDKVHCQAFYSRTSVPDIIDAVYQTSGQVLVDKRNKLLNTVYHANCGGETVNSEDLWLASLPYLRRKADRYCAHMPGSEWNKVISAEKFYTFTQSKYNGTLSQETWEQIIHFQQNKRKKYLDSKQKITLRSVREHFGLRSTYFSIEKMGEDLHFTGKGYGHGVGLCQEGAINRAKDGYSKDEILDFYYNNSKVITLQSEVMYQ